MSPEIADCIKVINNLQVPKPFMYDPSGAEISWLNPSLGGWLGSMVDRHYQLNLWLTCKDGPSSRPPSFWLTGFFNPTGFLTAVRQEICRAHAKDNWALDAVQQTNSVSSRNSFFVPDARLEGKNI
jgi:dynein heavy chain